MNKELQTLFEQDQADRSVFFEQWDHEQRQQVIQRDRARRQRVEELVASGMVQAPEDYFHLGESYCATRAVGQEVLTWHNIPQPELSYVCKEQEAPQLEVIQLGDQSAILIKSAEPSFMQLFLRVGEGYYVVGGQVALNERMRHLLENYSQGDAEVIP